MKSKHQPEREYHNGVEFVLLWSCDFQFKKVFQHRSRKRQRNDIYGFSNIQFDTVCFKYSNNNYFKTEHIVSLIPVI